MENNYIGYRHSLKQMGPTFKTHPLPLKNSRILKNW